MRWVAVTLALVAAALSVGDYRAWRASQGELMALAEDSGLAGRRPEWAAEMKRETVPSRGSLKLAWELLALEVDRGWLATLPADERQAESRRGVERLALARRLAEDVLLQQPASWQAATVLGAGRFLAAQRSRRLDQPISAWRDPLRAAMRLGPAYPEPAVFLAAAYLSRWSSLTAAERRELPPVLTRALEDRRGRELLVRPWVHSAPSLDRLLEPIPEDPDAWQALAREFLRRGDLERYGIAHRRWLESLPVELAERLRLGLARLGAGRTRSATGLLLSVLAAPTDVAHVHSFAAALAALPEDAAARARTDLRRWQDWSEDLCSVNRCPLGAETAQRLAELAGRGQESGPPWIDGDPPDRQPWSLGRWRRRGSAHAVQLRAQGTFRELRLEVPGVPSGGAAMELRWDGRLLGVAAIESGEPIVWRFTVEPGLHLLEVSRLGGRPLPPGDLELRPAIARSQSPPQRPRRGSPAAPRRWLE